MSILELGLGESTKFINTFNKKVNKNCKHVIVEHDRNWINYFNEIYNLDGIGEILHLPLINNNIHGNNVIGYQGFNNLTLNNFDLIIIDGPFGSSKFSRYDIVDIVNNYSINSEFIIIFDDTNRDGEMDTCMEIIKIF